MDHLHPNSQDSYFDMDAPFDDCDFSSFDGSASFINRSFGNAIDDPSKALQMDFMESRRDPLPSRRLSSADHGSAQTLNTFLSLDSMSADRRDLTLDHPTEFIHSAPVLSHSDGLSNHWNSHSADMNPNSASMHDIRANARFLGAPPGSASTMKDDSTHNTMGLPPPISEDTMRISTSDPQNNQVYHRQMQTHSHQNQTLHHLQPSSIPMSAPICDSSGGFQQMLNEPPSRPSPLRPTAQKRSFTESMDVSVSGGASGQPSPKRLKYITPGGTPTRDEHGSFVWTSTPHTTGVSPAMPITQSAGAPTVGLPPDVAIRSNYMDGPLPPPPPQFTHPHLPTYSVSGFSQQMWSPMHGFTAAPHPYNGSNRFMRGGNNPGMLPAGSVQSNHNMAGRRKRRRSSLGRSSLVPKVQRPSRAGAAEKWKNLSKKDREKARRAELKQCYQDLAVTLQMEAKRSGAQLPDRADIVRAACAEIRRLERTLGSLQGAPDCNAIKEQVKNNLN